MEPIYNIDADGNGKVTFYSYGHSYVADVKEWKASLPHQPPDGVVTLLAQRHVNQLKVDREEAQCGYLSGF